MLHYYVLFVVSNVLFQGGAFLFDSSEAVRGYFWVLKHDNRGVVEKWIRVWWMSESGDCTDEVGGSGYWRVFGGDRLDLERGGCARSGDDIVLRLIRMSNQDIGTYFASFKTGFS